jgi:hypothetical protein
MATALLICLAALLTVGAAAADARALGVKRAGFPVCTTPPTRDTTPIAKAPKPFVHPRLFFLADELPALRRLLLDASSTKGWKPGQDGNAPVPGAAGYVVLRNLLRGESWEEGTTGARMPLYKGPYKKLFDDLLSDAGGRPGKVDLSSAALGSKYGKDVVLHASNVAENGFGFTGLYGKLSGAAFVSLISKSEAPFDAKALGKVLGAACRHHRPIWKPVQEFAGYSFFHDSPDDLGTAYDWLYNDMAERDRADCRNLIAAMTGPERRELGVKYVDFPWTGFNWNWIGWHETIVVLAASIEGEHRDSNYTRFAADCNLVQSRYFLLESSEAGLAREALGYHTLGMNGAFSSAMIVARSRQNLFEVAATRAALHRMLLYRVYTAEPWIDQGEGLGTTSKYDSFSHGDQPNRHRPRSAIVMRKYYPTDPLAAWAFDRSDPIIHETEPLMSAVFATDSRPVGAHNNLAAVARTAALPENFFCRDRGEMVVRDHWMGNATVFDFEVKMNALSLGHNHVDRNSFYLYSRGRAWIVDNADGDVENEAHQTVLIDGLGQGGGATPRGADTFPAMPGIFLEYAEGRNGRVEFAAGVGDAKPAYDFAASCQPSSVAEGFKCVKSPYRQSNFVYPPAPYLNMPKFAGLSEAWMEDARGQYRMTGPIMQFNPVVRAFRSTLFVKSRSGGESAPWCLIVDDIRKDDKPHKYEFIMNLPWTDKEAGRQWQYRHEHEEVERDAAATAALKSDTDMILKDVRDPANSGPRLLVRVLRANGMAKGGLRYVARKELNVRKVIGGAKRLARHVVVEASSVSPDFCIFLYPHNQGDALPKTAWSIDRSELSVAIPRGDTTTWSLSKLASGRTRISPKVFGGGGSGGNTASTQAAPVTGTTARRGRTAPPAARVEALD